VPPGAAFRVSYDAHGNIMARLATNRLRRRSRAKKIHPIEFEVFKNLFLSIEEEMGVTLCRTGFSPNIKERLDYSCAVYDAAGQTIAQGDHMPVHLGAMPLSVRAAIDAGPMEPGDIVMLNDPFHGGTHLPDITLVSPVFLGRERTPAFFVANRAHHSDVGGMSPGSMPVAREIYQEGLILPPVKLASRGRMVDTCSRCAGERADADERRDLTAIAESCGGTGCRSVAAGCAHGRAIRALQTIRARGGRTIGNSRRPVHIR
jgi:N-methylhydantoinase B/oxoprolinase/acetone carboxylase alpha subunit